MREIDPRVNTSWWVLRIGLGLAPVIAGLDKYFNKLTDWTMYLNPLATKIIPVTPATFMHVVGVVEIVAGILILSRFTRLGAYVVMAWLIAISLNLLSMGTFFDIAVRDIELSLGAFVLGQLTAVREEALAHKPVPRDRTQPIAA